RGKADDDLEWISKGTDARACEISQVQRSNKAGIRGKRYNNNGYTIHYYHSVRQNRE
ncbi:hypothetical protein KI387_040213, partial [Taxus chinensis]